MYTPAPSLLCHGKMHLIGQATSQVWWFQDERAWRWKTWTSSTFPCIIELFTCIATAWWKKGIYTIKPTITEWKRSIFLAPQFYFCQLCMNSWCEALEAFCSFAFFKSTQLSSDKGQEHRNADFFFYSREGCNEFIYICRNIFHYGKLNPSSNFFYWLQNQS